MRRGGKSNGGGRRAATTAGGRALLWGPSRWQTPTLARRLVFVEAGLEAHLPRCPDRANLVASCLAEPGRSAG